MSGTLGSSNYKVQEHTKPWASGTDSDDEEAKPLDLRSCPKSCTRHVALVAFWCFPSCVLSVTDKPGVGKTSDSDIQSFFNVVKLFEDWGVSASFAPGSSMTHRRHEGCTLQCSTFSNRETCHPRRSHSKIAPLARERCDKNTLRGGFSFPSFDFCNTPPLTCAAMPCLPLALKTRKY